MRRSLFFVCVGILATAAFASVAGTTAATNSGADIYATGGGWEGAFGQKHFVHFDVSAHTGPQGDFGQIGYTINESAAPLNVSVNVDCVNVFPIPGLQGGAWVGGAVTKVSPQPNVYGIAPGDQLAFYAVDGGNPSAAPVDEFVAFFGLPGACKTLPFFGYYPDVTQGNVNIKTG
jgi:hypothetical protein